MLAGLESVAIANAVEDKQQDLAVDDELSLRTLKRGLDNPQKAPGVVDAALDTSRTRSGRLRLRFRKMKTISTTHDYGQQATGSIGVLCVGGNA